MCFLLTAVLGVSQKAVTFYVDGTWVGYNYMEGGLIKQITIYYDKHNMPSSVLRLGQQWDLYLEEVADDYAVYSCENRLFRYSIPYDNKCVMEIYNFNGLITHTMFKATASPISRSDNAPIYNDGFDKDCAVCSACKEERYRCQDACTYIDKTNGLSIIGWI